MAGRPAILEMVGLMVGLMGMVCHPPPLLKSWIRPWCIMSSHFATPRKPQPPTFWVEPATQKPADNPVK